MPTIINPYQNAGNSLGESLSGLGEAFFGPKASQSALYREKFREQARINENLPRYAGAMAAGGDPGEIARLGILSGQAGQDVGNYGRYVTVNRGASNLNAPPVTASILGAGGAMSSTPMGHTQTLQKGYDLDLAKTDRLVAAQQFKDARERVNVRDPFNPLGYKTITVGEFAANPGAYQEVTSQDILKSSIAGSPSGYISGFPGQTPSQGAYLGSAPATDKAQNWIWVDPAGRQHQGTTADNRTDLITGQPLPPGHVLRGTGAGDIGATSAGLGKTQTGGLDESIIAGEDSLRLAGQVKEMVQKNPNIVGPAGNVLRAGQNVTDLVASVQGLLGGPDNAKVDLARAQQTVRATLGPDASRLFPEIFNSNLNSVQTLHGLLTYKVARALNKGGTLSNMDVDRARALLGTPDSWFQGPTAFVDRMTAVEQQLGIELQDNLKRRGTNRASVGPQPASSAPTTAAPGVAPPPGFVLD